MLGVYFGRLARKDMGKTCLFNGLPLDESADSCHVARGEQARGTEQSAAALMHRLSSNGKRWHGFPGGTSHGCKVAAQNRKRWRIVDAGHAGLSKAEMRKLADDAVKTHRVTHVPAGKRRYPDPQERA